MVYSLVSLDCSDRSGKKTEEKFIFRTGKTGPEIQDAVVSTSGARASKQQFEKRIEVDFKNKISFEITETDWKKVF